MLFQLKKPLLNFHLITYLGLCFQTLNISFCFASSKVANETVSSEFKIGIIGGGIGGTATAYFLKEAFKKNALLYLYEPKTIGGRLSLSSKFDNKFYEAGGAIIHPQNKYMNDFIQEFGLEKNYECQSTRVGIFDGQEYAFVSSDWNIITLAKAILRYGLDLYWLSNYAEGMLKQFSRIYDHQKNRRSFKTVEELLGSMDPTFPSLVAKSIRSHLKENGYNDLIIDELVNAMTRANYGQSPDVHAFVGSVSVAAADPSIWSVRGGNKKVPELLLKHSEAQRLSNRVVEIFQMPDDKIRVLSKNKDGKLETHDFDAVSIATPLTEDKSTIKFSNFSKSFEFLGAYERIICSFVQGKLNGKNFKFKEVGVIVDEILTDNNKLAYNSVGLQFPIGNDRCNSSGFKVYKVFSPKPLTKEDLANLFESYSETEVIEWLAYPHYLSSERLGEFELSPGLYYNNAIEKAASAMEMSVIAAKNNALLIEMFLKKEAALNGTSKDEL